MNHPAKLRDKLALRCLAAALVTWAPLYILAHLSGQASGDPALRPLLVDLSVEARFLVTLPIFIYAMDFARPRLQSVLDYLSTSDMLIGRDRDRFEAAASDHNAWFDHRAAYIGVAVLAVLSSVATSIVLVNGERVSWFSNGGGELASVSAAGWYFAIVSLTIWHFVALRCIWQFLNWSIFLGRLARLDMKLVPTHPDRCGGIGILEMGQLSFSVLGAGAASILSASLAESLIAGSISPKATIPYIAIFVLMCVVVALLPLLGFARALMRAKRLGLVSYGDLGEGLFRAFGAKWTGLSNKEEATLLGGTDPSSLADYGYAYEVVTEMRVSVIGRNGFVAIIKAAMIPFIPLLFIVSSVAEIIERLLGFGG